MKARSERLKKIAARWDLPENAAPRLDALLGTLESENETPTAVVEAAAAIDVHLADSLSVLEVEGFRSLPGAVDIGSGAGFPGVVLAIALPETRFDLLESSRRKCAFLERVIGTLDLENARVVCARAEEWGDSEGRERYAGAVVRAVGELATLVEYAAPLLRLEGVLVAWKGRRDPDEELRAARAAEALGMRPAAIMKVEPFAGSRNHHLHVYEKTTPTPEGYPRRSGMAKKRPLGGRRETPPTPG